MREIKFRVWDKKHKKMYLPNSGADFLLSQNGTLYCWGDIQENTGMISIQKENLVVQFYTGLLDKNGKEIYEGDIMKITYHGTNSTYDIHREVWWDDETTRFINASKKYEVIGNKWDEK